MNNDPHNENKIVKRLDNSHDKQISCFIIIKDAKKRYENVSSFLPLIIINQENLVSVLDTVSPVPLIHKNDAFENKSIFDNPITTQGTFIFTDKDLHASHIGKK
jgi:hypothetical protein